MYSTVHKKNRASAGGSATPRMAGASATFTGESRGLDADLYIVEVSADLEVAAP